MKNATPDDAATSLESCFAELRPQAICLDKSVQTLSDPATLRTQVFHGYADVHVQTGTKMIFQWHPKYASQVLPFAIPRMVSGPDYYPDRVWRRSREDGAVLVAVHDFVSGFARRPGGGKLQNGLVSASCY